MIIVRLLSPEPVGWFCHHQLYSGVGADIVMESIALIYPEAKQFSFRSLVITPFSDRVPAEEYFLQCDYDHIRTFPNSPTLPQNKRRVFPRWSLVMNTPSPSCLNRTDWRSLYKA